MRTLRALLLADALIVPALAHAAAPAIPPGPDLKARAAATVSATNIAIAAEATKLQRDLARAALANPADSPALTPATSGCTVTVPGTGTATAGFGTTYQYSSNPSLFTVFGGVPTLSSSPYYRVISVSDQTGGKQVYGRFDFSTASAGIDFRFVQGSSNPIRIMLNGQYLADASGNSSWTLGLSGRNLLTVNCTTHALRRWGAEINGNGSGFDGVNVVSGETIFPTPTANRWTIAYIGDSEPCSTGAQFAASGFPELYGFRVAGVESNVVPICLGGTGVINAGTALKGPDHAPADLDALSAYVGTVNEVDEGFNVNDGILGDAVVTASIAGTDMSVTVLANGVQIISGQQITCADCLAGSKIVRNTSGNNGGVGHYLVSPSQTVASQSITVTGITAASLQAADLAWFQQLRAHTKYPWTPIVIWGPPRDSTGTDTAKKAAFDQWVALGEKNAAYFSMRSPVQVLPESTTATITAGTIASGVLTVTTKTGNSIAVGQFISASTSIPCGVQITGSGSSNSAACSPACTGTGGTGTYAISNPTLALTLNASLGAVTSVYAPAAYLNGGTTGIDTTHPPQPGHDLVGSVQAKARADMNLPRPISFGLDLPALPANDDRALSDKAAA